jgi:hypothetical protein
MSAQDAPVVRPIVFLSLLLILAGVAPGVRLARAQSLADVAKKEEARRKTVPEATKVYTNKDLSAQPAGSPPPPSAAKPAKTEDAPKDGETKESKDAKDKEPAKDKSYWSGRMSKLQEQIDRDEIHAQATQTQVNVLTAEFVNHGDPGQRLIIEQNRQKALAELNRLTQSITDGKKSVADLEEEARRAGVPPGWLR